jgi:predicted permease
MPLVTFLVLKAFGLGGQAALIAILFHALPTASSSYVMARQLGGDAPLMAGICALQTVLAALTVPVALLLLAPAL